MSAAQGRSRVRRKRGADQPCTVGFAPSFGFFRDSCGIVSFYPVEEVGAETNKLVYICGRGLSNAPCVVRVHAIATFALLRAMSKSSNTLHMP